MKVWQDAFGQFVAQGMKGGVLVTCIEDTREAAIKAWGKA